MAKLADAKDPVDGGCLCGKVRYTIEFPAGSLWPPAAHTCQCTQCRKHSGSLVVHFITVSISQLVWRYSSASDSRIAAAPYKEFSSSTKCRRGLCSECGSALTFRSDDAPDEMEILVGSIDEIFLIGDRSSRIASETLVQKGKLKETFKEEEKDAKVLGKDLCLPLEGNFFFRNAVHGVSDMKVGGKMFVEGSKPEWIIPE